MCTTCRLLANLYSQLICLLLAEQFAVTSSTTSRQLLVNDWSATSKLAAVQNTSSATSSTASSTTSSTASSTTSSPTSSTTSSNMLAVLLANN